MLLFGGRTSRLGQHLAHTPRPAKATPLHSRHRGCESVVRATSLYAGPPQQPLMIGTLAPGVRVNSPS